MAAVSNSTAQEGRDTPKEIKFNSLVVDVCFHPERDVIAAADIDGDVTIHSYSISEENHLLFTLNHHKKSCRAVQFSEPGGNKLFTISKDKSLQVVDVERGAVSQAIKKAHSAALYSLLVVDENIAATGDDDGTLKVWDMRQQKAVMELKENDEFISDMVLDRNNRQLITSSGDGTITAFDIRKHKMKLQSELFDSELLSLAAVKNQTKLVCGCGEGVLNIFNWGEWGNLSDRFPGHPMSIDCIVPLNDDIILTGSFDGVVRAVNVLPNRFLGVIGEHDEFPVENLSLSRCRTYLASCSHDQKIKFWNVSDVNQETVDTSKRAKKTNKPKMLNKAMAKEDFFADLTSGAAETGGDGGGGGDGDGKDGDEDDDDDEEEDDDSEMDNSDDDDDVDGSDKLDTDGDSDNEIGDDDDADNVSDEDEEDVNRGTSGPPSNGSRPEDCEDSSEEDNES